MVGTKSVYLECSYLPYQIKTGFCRIKILKQKNNSLKLNYKIAITMYSPNQKMKAHDRIIQFVGQFTQTLRYQMRRTEKAKFGNVAAVRCHPLIM